MFKLDDKFLTELGLGSLPPVEKNKMLAHIYETLEMRVGMKLAEKMSNEQLDEFEAFIKNNNESGALKWLESNFPNYKQVVAEQLESLKTEIIKAAPQILAQTEGAKPKPQESSISPVQPGAVVQTPPMPTPTQPPQSLQHSPVIPSSQLVQQPVVAPVQVQPSQQPTPVPSAFQATTPMTPASQTTTAMQSQPQQTTPQPTQADVARQPILNPLPQNQQPQTTTYQPTSAQPVAAQPQQQPPSPTSPANPSGDVNVASPLPDVPAPQPASPAIPPTPAVKPYQPGQ